MALLRLGYKKTMASILVLFLSLSIPLSISPHSGGSQLLYCDEPHGETHIARNTLYPRVSTWRQSTGTQKSLEKDPLLKPENGHSPKQHFDCRVSRGVWAWITVRRSDSCPTETKFCRFFVCFLSSDTELLYHAYILNIYRERQAQIIKPMQIYLKTHTFKDKILLYLS